MQTWHLPSVLSAFDRLLAYDLVFGARTGARLVAGADEVGLADKWTPVESDDPARFQRWSGIPPIQRAGVAGLEPATYGFGDRRSTN
jgi:hypothetical protein